ncbi:RNA-directed DNA polymerase, eukaryota, Reverse transcriptase zinc-binding domain protein [Artemisia annua]|uniref:RNA-directed DNA polymerase, eukaryota, Reverse transcriptase zinc-binding domain protein n=1 Tax=Artemisia annua TaxID=35608 RepID=A0A2U1KTB7_ARTAN|nr:RNA-directed DNA polymerase, eukaryota, Reverse transcriptase zinc-binding domain protein [Artemisia annua]
MLFKKKLGNGRNTTFWHDNWLVADVRVATDSTVNNSSHHHEDLQGNNGPILQPNIPITGQTFHWAWRRTLRSHEENMELCELQDLLLNLNLSMEQDTWEFTPSPSRCFLVKSMRKTISNTLNNITLQSTRWNKLLPTKVNIMSWRVCNQRLPTRENLDKRGIDLDSVLCPICNSDIETKSHLFATCLIARNIWKDVFSWWLLSDTHITSIEDLVPLSDHVPLENKLKPFFDVVASNLCWVGLMGTIMVHRVEVSLPIYTFDPTSLAIWKARNHKIFSAKEPNMKLILG